MLGISLGAAGDAVALTYQQAAGAGHVAFEAEGVGEVVNGAPEVWEVVAEAEASGGSALSAGGTNSTGDSPHSFAQYQVQFATEGTYYLYYRWRADEARTAGDVFTANSMWVPFGFGDFRTPGDQVEFVTSASNDTQAPANNAYAWHEDIGVSYVVGAGEVGTPQVLSFGTREAGMVLDRFVLSTQSALTGPELDALINSDTDLVVQAPGSNLAAWEAEKKVTVVEGTPENWEVVAEAEASGGSALSAGGTNSTGDSPHSFAQYQVQFATEGTYYLYYRWRADEARTAGDVFTANSMWVPFGFGDFRTPGDQVEFVTSASNDTQAPANNAYAWHEDIGVSYVVGAGEVGTPQVLSFGTREAGMILDRFVLSTQSALTGPELDAVVNSGETALSPEIESATGSSTFTDVTVTFTRPLAAGTVGPEDFTFDNGVTVSAADVDADDPRIVTLTTSAQPEETVLTLGVSGVTDTSGVPIDEGAEIQFSSWALRPGWVRKEIYFSIPGSSVFDLQDDPRYMARQPDRVEYVQGFQLDLPLGNDYGAHLEAFFIPPESGAWDLFVSNDDEAELFLSTDDSAANLNSLAFFSLSPPEFDDIGSVTSPALTAGERYLLVGQLKQGTGDVYLNVGARQAGVSDPPTPEVPVLGGEMIATYIDPALAGVEFDVQPQAATAPEGGRAHFTVEVTPVSDNPVYYQWMKNGEPVAGGNRAFYTTPVLAASDNGASYSCMVTIAGGEFASDPAALTVGPAEPTGLRPLVGLNFFGGGGGGGAGLEPAEPAGVVLQENWNNLMGTTFFADPLWDAEGVSDGLTVTIETATNSWYSGAGTGVGSADSALLQGMITQGAAGLEPLTVTIGGVPAGDYHVYIYSVGFDFDPDLAQASWVVGESTTEMVHSEAETGLVYIADPAWRRATSTDVAAPDTGNYVAFEDVRPAADGTVQVNVEWEGVAGYDEKPVVNAVQLVEVVGTMEPPTGPFEINSVSLGGGLLSVSWVGGTGPFDVLWSTTAKDGEWSVVESTASRDAFIVVTDTTGFVKIVDKAP